MAAAVPLREDFSAVELRPFAKRSTDAHQSRRLLSLAAVRDGIDRGEAAKIGGMTPDVRDWVHEFNADGPAGLVDNWKAGPSRESRRSSWQRSPNRSRRVRPGG